MTPVSGRAGPAGERALVHLVNLLGVRVSVRAMLDLSEHERRVALGMTAITDPVLLGLLQDMPVGHPTPDPIAWAETSRLPAGVVARGDDGCTVTRLLKPVLTVHDVIVSAPPRCGLRAVQDASLFASYAQRWVALPAEPPEAVLLEAKLCGVGMVDLKGQVILSPEPPQCPAADGWAWLLGEKAYRRWLAEHSQGGRPLETRKGSR
jgi:hypothetical protein